MHFGGGNFIQLFMNVRSVHTRQSFPLRAVLRLIKLPTTSTGVPFATLLLLIYKRDGVATLCVIPAAMGSPREILQIRITDEERISGVLDLAKLQEALIALQTDGTSSMSCTNYQVSLL